MMRTLARTLAAAVGTGFYTGYFPIAPGTVGSAAGIALYALLVKLGALSDSSLHAWMVTWAVIFLIGVPSARHLETRFGPDNKRIVIDEIWGMMISLSFVPPSPAYVIAGFLLFRIFDIVKPFPGRRAERVRNGIGVMLDDGIAGLYACVILHLARAVLG